VSILSNVSRLACQTLSSNSSTIYASTLKLNFLWCQMSMFVKRPKRGDNDDDLLAFQEEFLHHKASGDTKPAAKVTRVHQSTDTSAPEQNSLPEKSTHNASSNSEQIGMSKVTAKLNLVILWSLCCFSYMSFPPSAALSNNK